MNQKISEIYCPSCGAAAAYDILHREYRCGHCGQNVGISEALEQKKGFRKILGDKLKKSIKDYQLFHGVCEGCGADLVFEENEALATCPFCGKSMVRNEYLKSDDMPESVIPFAIREAEAKKLLKDWCDHNRSKPEARKLTKLIEELKGYYLPYELVRGPVGMSVGRMDANRRYYCEGFINDGFVNRSGQLNNLLLDGMEPFDINELSEFDFGYIAGQRVKIADINDEKLQQRSEEETAEVYTPSIRKVLESQAVEVDADVGSSLRLPVLLPVYYICKDGLMAAVNGQTGKVAVRALKDSHYYFLPWWLKAILATLIFTGVIFLALHLFGMTYAEALYISLLLAAFFIIVTLCLYSDTTHNRFAVVSGRNIYTSGSSNFVRRFGELVLSDKILKRKVEKPVFFEKIDGQERAVELKFTTPLRIIRMILLCLVVLFLPVILALLINGFNFRQLELGGSAVWFCIFVPVVPIYLLKFGIVELYDNPWIYIIDEKGRKKRYRQKFTFKINKDMVLSVLKALFVPPVSLAVWFGIFSFFTMVYLTAFGFE